MIPVKIETLLTTRLDSQRHEDAAHYDRLSAENLDKEGPTPAYFSIKPEVGISFNPCLLA